MSEDPADIDVNGLTDAGAEKIINRAHKAHPSAKFTSGRRAALAVIDQLMGKRVNVQKLYNALQERMDVDPVGLYKEVILPVTPRSVIDGEGEVGEGSKRTVVHLPVNGREAPSEGAK